jgi:hypothetical protein
MIKQCSWCKKSLNPLSCYQLQGEEIICFDCADNIDRELLIIIRTLAHNK